MRPGRPIRHARHGEKSLDWITAPAPRILVVATDLAALGGAETYTRQLVIHLAAAGFRVIVVCHTPAKDLPPAVEYVIVPRFEASRLYGLWRLTAILRPFANYLRLFGSRRCKPAAIIGGPDALTWAVCQHYRETPLISVPHALITPLEVATYPSISRLQRWSSVTAAYAIERWTLSRASAVVRFSQFACDRLRQYYGPRVRAPLVVFPQAIERMPDPARLERQHGDYVPRLLSIGRLIPSKNLAFALSILANLRDARWEFDIVGDGSEMESLKQQARELDIAERVHFHGFLADVSRFYRSAGLLLFPSVLENQPLVVLEAMSYSVPVLAFRGNQSTVQNALHEVVSDGENGLLADSPESFRMHLASFLSSPERFSDMGQAGRRTVEQNHLWCHHFSRYMDLFVALRIGNVATG